MGGGWAMEGSKLPTFSKLQKFALLNVVWSSIKKKLKILSMRNNEKQ
jgi:hypothetical protein